jgi:hypothetical protein
MMNQKTKISSLREMFLYAMIILTGIIIVVAVARYLSQRLKV